MTPERKVAPTGPVVELEGQSTLIRGGRGVPAMVVRDSGGHAAAVAAEQRRQQDGEIKALLDGIRKAAAREAAPPPRHDELSASAKAHAEAAHRARRAPHVALQELTLLEAWGASVTPDPGPPVPTRRGVPLSTADVAHEQALAAAFERKTAAAACPACGGWHAPGRCIFAGAR